MIAARRWLEVAAVAAVVIAFALILGKNAQVGASQRLINVSYDPTRELYQTLNPLFVAAYEKQTGRHLTMVQSHGGSSRQARRVIAGEQTADVVTLGVCSDIGALQKHGLIAPGWRERLPNHAVPYTSTVVFVVRKGNPRHIADWPDLLAPDVEIVTPDPRTSGNGKLAALAAWASVVARGGTEEQARAFLTALYQHAAALDEGARDAAIRFALQDTGDVHLTWENEAIRETAEANGNLQIIYPPISVLAEPCVARVDRLTERSGNRQAADAYLAFLFSDAAQEAIARLGYRPLRPGQGGAAFPDIDRVPVSMIAGDWDDANEKFFGENGIIDTILGSRRR